MAFALLAIFTLQSGQGNSTSAAPHVPFQGLDLEPLVGGDARLTLAELRGKVAVVNFWGTWCSYCQIEMPYLAQLHDQWRDNPEFQLVSVSCSDDVASEKKSELVSQTEAYLNRKAYKFPVYWDPNGRSRRALLEVTGMKKEGLSYPSTLVLDRNGAIRAYWPGYKDGLEAEIDLVVREALKPDPPRSSSR